MIGKIEFLNLPGSMSSCEFPLLTSATQSLSSYTLKTFSNVKFSLDLVQTVRVPYFTNYDKANCVRMNGEIYWITAVKNETMADTTLIFALQYNGASSLVHKSDVVKGIWERTGNTNADEWMRITPYSGESYIADYEKLPSLRVDTGADVFWVQITSTEHINSNTSTTAYDIEPGTGGRPSSNPTKINDSITVYGMFVKGSGVAMGHSTNITYPSLADVITNMEIYGLLGSNIMDISISERCPFTYQYSSGNISVPICSETIYYDVSSSGQQKIMYDVTSIMNNSSVGTASVISPNWTEEQWRLGYVTIRNIYGQIVGTVPLKYFDGSLSMEVKCDFSGVYTRISSSSSDVVIIINEGKLPWVGSTWEEYRAYSMAFDRQSVQNANTKEAVNAIGNSLSGITSGLLTGAIVGGPVGAVAGFISGTSGVLGSMVNYKGNTEYAKSEQANLEKRMEAQPGTAYSPQEGISYIYESWSRGARICLELPYGQYCDSNQVDLYLNNFGYPADGTQHNLTIAEGYYKGKLLYTTAFARGLKFDECNSEFINGFRFKEV